MYIKRSPFIIALLVLLFFSLAFQIPEDSGWHTIFEWVIGVVLILLGAPLTQVIKVKLGWSNKLALLLTAVVATVIAVAELVLTQALDFQSFTLENFPYAFGVVFSAATIYYQLLKGSDTIFGTRLLLPTE